ncbi:MAG: two-component regulator propeller domain-containing protein [Bacteroidota bacterium]
MIPLQRRIAWLGCWLCMQFCVQAWAQSSTSLLRFEHLTVNNGLAHSDAMAVVQDQQGFIWIGTNKGVDRYDGNQIQNYSFHDSSSETNNRIRTLYVSPDGQLWVGTENGGLNYYDREKDRLVVVTEALVPNEYRTIMGLLTKAYVTALAMDKKGQLWVGTQGEGVFLLKQGPQGQYEWIKRVALPQGNRTQFDVSAITVDKRGAVWIGTKGLGLYYIPPYASHTQQHQMPRLQKAAFAGSSIQALHLDQQGNLWLGADEKIYVGRQTTLKTGHTAIFEAIHPTATFPGVASLHLDSFSRLWVATGFGLYILHPAANSATQNQQPSVLQQGTIERILPQDGVAFSLNSGRLHQIIEDKFQVIWMATSAGGINKVDLLAKPFGHLQRQLTSGTSLPSNYINAIYKEEDQNLLWIATRNGFSKYNPVQKTYQNYFSRELGGDATGVDVSSIFQDSQNTLWFGTWSDGFTCLRREGKRERLASHRAKAGKEGLPSNAALSFAEDGLGYIWVATADAGLVQYTKQGQFRKAYHPGNSGLPTAKFLRLYFDAATDVLWASTQDAGLLKLQAKADTLLVIKHFQANPRDSLSLCVKYTWPLLKDHRGNLWVGTLGGGLHQLVKDRNGQEVVVRYRSWLPETDVESMQEDAQGNLWIGGAGLLRFNPQTKQYIRFDVADGLQSNSFKVGASCQAKDGTLYFGGIHGLNYFLPQAIQPNPYPPKVFITGLRIFNQPIRIGEEHNGSVLLTKNLPLTDEITIQASQNDFSLEFVALHYANTGKNRFAYQLEGYHKGWNYPSVGTRFASFSNLAAGMYTFRVKACNGDGVWSSGSASLRIRVLPPWWKTGWAYAVYGLSILSLLLVYRNIMTKQQALKSTLALEKWQHAQDQQQLVLEKRQREKEQELTDLKLRFFTNVSHELRTPLTLILGPLEELLAKSGKWNGMRDQVLLMHRQTRKLLDLVNQLMDFRKAASAPLRMSESDIVLFAQEIFLMFQPKAQEKQIDYTFQSDYPTLLLHFDRHQLEILLVNLLSNAFKYTPEGRKIQCTLALVGHPNEAAVYQADHLQTNYLELQVRDWGVGIHPDELDKIFDLYYQAQHTDTMQVMGTGIGLSLVKQIVQRHQGSIRVESQLGEGSVFTCRLPLGRAHLNPADIQPYSPEEEMHYPKEATASAAPPAEFPALSNCRLLIVEDNEDVLLYLNRLFESLLKVQVARNGQEGWEKVLQEAPDLVLSDIMMPQSTGLELCQQIKQHPQTMHIPVILLTARTSALYELEGLETGADDYITKPFHPQVLQAKVVSMLLNRQKLQEHYQRQILLQPSEITIPDEDRALLETAMKIVEAHLENHEFGVQVLVREMGMSQSVFYRRIKSITGQSAIEFIQDVRMKRAAQYLKDSSLQVSEVALKVGMEDVKHFRKIFQKRYHVSPSEYAKNLMNTL